MTGGLLGSAAATYRLRLLSHVIMFQFLFLTPFVGARDPLE